MPSREALGPIFRVFGMTRPGIEPRSPSLRADTLTTRPLSWFMIFEVKLYEILAINIVVATVLIDCPSPVVGVLLWFW